MLINVFFSKEFWRELLWINESYFEVRIVIIKKKEFCNVFDPKNIRSLTFKSVTKAYWLGDVLHTLRQVKYYIIILKDNLSEAISNMFQQDNAHTHSLKRTKTFLELWKLDETSIT